MKILITGGEGLLGQTLLSLLNRHLNIEPIVTVKKNHTHNPDRASIIPLDITLKNEVDRVILDSTPATVIHAAAMTRVDQCEQDQKTCYRTNTTAVEYLVRACEKINAHLIFISTDFVFDGSKDFLDEEATPDPINCYGKSKLQAEEIVKNSSLPWTIIRTSLVYGTVPSLTHSNILMWIKKKLEDEQMIYMVTDQWRTPTLVNDLAMGCCLVAQKKTLGIYHIAGEEIFTPYELALRIAKFFNLNPSYIKSTTSNQLNPVARRPAKTSLVVDKAKNQLGYCPHTLHEGLDIVSAALARFPKDNF